MKYVRPLFPRAENEFLRWEGKGIANSKRLPGPFNHDWAVGLMEISIKLLKDKSFCTAQVGVRPDIEAQ